MAVEPVPPGGPGLVPLRASDLAADDGQVLALPAPLDGLFPYGGVVRGNVVAIDSPALALALLAAASATGAWCAVAGLPALGLAAVAEAGIDLRRFVVVPTLGERWPVAVATLLDGFGAVVVRLPRDVRSADARRVAARARERRSTLFALGGWPQQADVSVRSERSVWTGLDHGYGRLTGRQCSYVSGGRGAAAEERRVTAWLPAGR